VGDVASQEAGGSRLVDSSTLRWQLSLREIGPDALPLAGWRVQVGGYEVPLRSVPAAGGDVRLIGLRYRDFMPWRGLHPAIKPLGPLTMTLVHTACDEALEVTLHGWRPDGLAYAGLPGDPEIAAARRAERFVSRRLPRGAVPAGQAPPPEALTSYTFDLRRLSNLGD
jgi:uncharacterized protein (DUF2126 family)